MTGFKVVLKVQTLTSISKVGLEQLIKANLEHPINDLKVLHVKAKGIACLTMQDPVAILNSTIDRRNTEIGKLNQAAYESDKHNARLQEANDYLNKQVIKLRDMLDNNTECDCSDWDSVGTDPYTGDKLKKCNLCHQIGVR